MQKKLTEFLSKRPDYRDPTSSKFMEGIRAARNLFPRRGVTDYLLRRIRLKKKNKIEYHEHYSIAIRDNYVRQHIELLPKLTLYVKDILQGIKKPYKTYSLPRKSVLSSLYKQIREREVVHMPQMVAKQVVHGFYLRAYPDIIEDEEDEVESYRKLAFFYCLYMIDSGVRIPLRMFNPISHVLEEVHFLMMKDLYGIAAIHDEILLVRQMLLLSGVEQNPGPKVNCEICQIPISVSNNLKNIECPICKICPMPQLYEISGMMSQDVDLMMRQNFRRMRCSVCYGEFKDVRKLKPTKVDRLLVFDKQSLFLQLLEFVKCKDCYYFTQGERVSVIESIPGYSWHYMSQTVEPRTLSGGLFLSSPLFQSLRRLQCDWHVVNLCYKQLLPFCLWCGYGLQEENGYFFNFRRFLIRVIDCKMYVQIEKDGWTSTYHPEWYPVEGQLIDQLICLYTADQPVDRLPLINQIKGIKERLPKYILRVGLDLNQL